MTEFKRTLSLFLLVLSLALVVGGSAFFASGADGAGPGAVSGPPLLVMERVVGDPGFVPLVCMTILLLATALLVYPWRPPVPEAPVVRSQLTEETAWPPAPAGPVPEPPRKPPHHWARPDGEEG